MVALLVFTLCSLLAGLAGNIAALAVVRALQGLGGGLLNPVGQAIGLSAVPRDQRGRLMSLFALPLIIGPVCGPPLAGWLIASASWRWIFLINIPIGVVALIASARILPADPARESPAPVERIDGAGLVLLPGGAVLIVLGATLLDRTWHGVIVLIAGLTMAGLFVRRARRPSGTTPPLVDLRLLSRRPFRGGTAVTVLFSAAYFGSMALLPLYAQGVRGDSAAVVGALSLPQAIAVGLTAQIASRLADRIPPRRIVIAGTATGLAGAVGMLAATWADAGYPLLLTAAVLVGVGSGATLMPAMILVVRDLDGADTPRATTLLNLVQRLAAAVGTAAVAVVANLLLTRHLPGGAAAMLALSPEARQLHRPALSTAMALTHIVSITLTAAALLTALHTLRAPRRTRPRPEKVTQ